MRTGEELYPRGTAPGAPCVIVRGPDFLGLTTGREPRRELRPVISATRDDNEFTAERLPGLLKAANS
jgi:hypothetical protein